MIHPTDIMIISITEFRRRPKKAYDFADVFGHVVFITRRGKKDLVMTSVATYLEMTQHCTSEDMLKKRQEILELCNRSQGNDEAVSGVLPRPGQQE